jgi:hypothetical protein
MKDLNVKNKTRKHKIKGRKAFLGMIQKLKAINEKGHWLVFLVGEKKSL